MLALAGFVGFCLLVCAVQATVALGTVPGWYLSLTAPPGVPPRWLFAAATLLAYGLVGIAGWLIWQRCGAAHPVRLWGWQLGASATLAPAFFALHSPPLTMLAIFALLTLVALTFQAFARVYHGAAWLMLPYAVWLMLMGVLDGGFWWLNAA